MAGKKSDIYRHFSWPRLQPQDIARFQETHLRMIADLADLFKQRRRRPPGTAAAPTPVDPKKPNTLTGGAAAALDFD